MMTTDSESPEEELIKYVVARKTIRGVSRDQVIAVINEIPLSIFMNGKEIVTLLCTGHHPGALAVGFLKSEGLLNEASRVVEISVDDEKGAVSITAEGVSAKAEDPSVKRTVTSGCGKGTMFYQAIDSLLTAKIRSSLTVTSEQVCQLMSQLSRRSSLYKETRGVHNVALATPESILLFRSDIGRHNAVDMICGECFLENIPLEDKLLLTTGRITSEILLKAARMRTPFVISRNVATFHSITVGQDIGITLIGDMRGDKFTVYAHPERVTP
jgi:FdhD protein